MRFLPCVNGDLALDGTSLLGVFVPHVPIIGKSSLMLSYLTSNDTLKSKKENSFTDFTHKINVTPPPKKKKKPKKKTTTTIQKEPQKTLKKKMNQNK